MTSLPRRLWRRAPGLVLAALLALVLAAVFALRLTQAALQWQAVPPDRALAGWMTPRYVVQSWDVPPDLVADALALQRDGLGRRITLEALAKERGVPVDALISALDAAIGEHRAGQP